MAAHMVVAAYVVGRLPDRVGLRRRDAAGPPRPLPPPRASSSGSPSPPSRPRSRWASVTRSPAGSTTTSRRSSPRSSWCPRRAATCPRCSSATSTREGKVTGGIPIPGLASILSDPSTGTSTVVQGLERDPRRRPADQPRGQRHAPRLGHHGRPGHAAVPADPVVLGVAGSSAGTCREPLVPAHRVDHRGAGRDHDGGRLGGERGRPPAVDRLRDDEGRGRGHREHRHLGHVRRRRRPLHRAGRHHRPRAARHEPPLPAPGRGGQGFDEADVPYGPEPRSADELEGARADEHRRRRRPVPAAITMYAVFGGRRLRCRLLGPRRRRHQARRASPRGDRPLDRPGVGGQPRLADLRLRGAVDLLPAGLRVDHPDPVRPADARRVRHRAARRGLRLPQGGVPHPRPAQLRCRVRALVGAGALLPGRRAPAASPRAGCRPAAWRATRGQLGQPHLDPRRAARREPGAYLAVVLPRRRRPAGSRTTPWWSTSGGGRSRRRSPPGPWRWSGIFVLSADAKYVFDGLTSRALPLVILSAVCGLAALVLLPRRARRGPGSPPSARWPPSSSHGRVAQWDYLLPTSLTVSAGAAPAGTIAAVLVATGLAVAVLLARRSCCSTCSTRSRCCPRRGVPEPTPARAGRSGGRPDHPREG